MNWGLHLLFIALGLLEQSTSQSICGVKSIRTDLQCLSPRLRWGGHSDEWGPGLFIKATSRSQLPSLRPLSLSLSHSRSLSHSLSLLIPHGRFLVSVLVSCFFSLILS